jgi:hypothetical protein
VSNSVPGTLRMDWIPSKYISLEAQCQPQPDTHPVPHWWNLMAERAGLSSLTSHDDGMERARALVHELMRSVCDTPSYRSARKLNRKGGAALLEKMRKGAQQLSDFADEHALWGYVNAVAPRRAFNVCESFVGCLRHDATGHFEAALCGRRRIPLHVVSLGGGPGCCLMGLVVFERLQRAASTDAATVEAHGEEARLYCFDYASGWETIVQRVSTALREPIAFGHCDLARGLETQENSALQACVASEELDVFLFIYSLHEADHARHHDPSASRWADLFLACWDRAQQGAVFVVKDQSWLEDTVLRLLTVRRPAGFRSCAVPRAAGVRALAHESEGLFLLKVGDAAQNDPSARPSAHPSARKDGTDVVAEGGGGCGESGLSSTTAPNPSAPNPSH